MKTPRTPPVISEVWEKIQHDHGRFGTIFGSASLLVKGKYLHWDKLRYYDPPNDIAHDEWWLAIKHQRLSLYKDIPLRDKNFEPFKFLTVDQMVERLHHIDQGAGGLIQLPDQISSDMRDRYIVSSLIQEAITSSQLEGAATTRPVAKEMIRTGRKPKDKSEQMILNNYQTMRRIGEYKDRPLSKELVLEIHRLITNQTLDQPDAAGRFRKQDEKIHVTDEYGEIFHDPPLADQLEIRMATMCDFANGKIPTFFIHPVLRAIILHFWLAYDHPFVDGNGRVARVLFYWSMLRHKYWLFEFISISQIILNAPTKYGRAFLYTETDDNDLTYFILYHLDVIHRAVQELHSYLQKKTEQIQTLERELRGMTMLNSRQRTLVSHALRHRYYEYSFESHQRSHGVVYQTGRQDLMNLEKRGLLTKHKVGKVWYFRPVEDLENKLRKVP